MLLPQVTRVVDGSVAVRAVGSGPPIVFVHGTSCSSRAFLRQLESALSESFRLFAIDLPGHGESNPPRDSSQYSVPGYAASLRRSLAELGAEHAVLVGWSLGGHVVLEAAPELPGLAGCMVFGTAPGASVPEIMSAYHNNPAIAHAFQAHVTEAELLALLRLFLCAGSPVPAFLVEDFRRTDPRSRSAVAESVGRGEMRDKRAIVGGMSAQLAVVHGARDAIVRRDFLAGVEMPTLWRGAIQDITDAGHAVQWEAATQFNELLGAFAAECHSSR